MKTVQAIHKEAFSFENIYKKPKYLIVNNDTLNMIKMEIAPIFNKLEINPIKERNELFGLKIIMLDKKHDGLFNHWEIGYDV